MKRLSFLLCLFILSNSIFAQNEVPDKPFIKLKTGKVITGSNLTLDEKIIKASVITLDGVEYKTNLISFYGYNKNSVYGRMKNLELSYYEKSNLYFYKRYVPPSYNTSTNTYTGGGYIHKYSNGIDQMKSITLNNFIKDVKHDESVILQFKEAVQYRTKSRLFFLSAIACYASFPFVFEFVPKGHTITRITLPAAAVFTVLSFINYRKKWKTFDKAFFQYTNLKLE